MSLAPGESSRLGTLASQSGILVNSPPSRSGTNPSLSLLISGRDRGIPCVLRVRNYDDHVAFPPKVCDTRPALRFEQGGGSRPVSVGVLLTTSLLWTTFARFVQFTGGWARIANAVLADNLLR